MKFFHTIDPAANMRKVKTPGADPDRGERQNRTVPEQVALEEAAFKEGGNKDVTAKVVPGVNHLFVEDAGRLPGQLRKAPGSGRDAS
jgi:hypothetical protein